MSLAQLWASFQSLPSLPKSKFGLSAADSPVCGFVYVPGPCGCLQWTLLWGWEFLLLLQHPQVFSAGGFEALFLHAGTLSCSVCLAPQSFLLVYPHANVGLLRPPATSLPQVLSNWLPVSTLLPVWVNVSSLTPWLSDFHTVQFSVSCFLFFKFVVVLWVVHRGTMYLSMPPSWPCKHFYTSNRRRKT